MRFPLRRNANVLDTLLAETLQIFIIFSIMGWPFSGMQQCETKRMNMERVVVQQQEAENKQQQRPHYDLHLQEQHHYHRQQQQKFHKIPMHTKHLKQIVGLTANVRERPLTATTVLEGQIPNQQRGMLAPTKSTTKESTMSLSSFSSLDTHDMHSTVAIITKDYKDKSAPNSIARGNMAYTQPTVTTTTLLANEVTAHSNVPNVLSEPNNEKVNVVVGVQPPADIILYSSLASSFAQAAAPLHQHRRVSKDIAHISSSNSRSKVYATQLPLASSESTNDSHEIDNGRDYVISEHIALLTHPTNNDGDDAREFLYKNTNNNFSYINNSNNNNTNININNTKNSNNRKQTDLMSFSLLSVSDNQNMEITTIEEEIAADTSLTSSRLAMASLSPLKVAESASASSSAAVAAGSAALSSASLTSADVLTDSYAAASEMATSQSNRKLPYDRINDTANEVNSNSNNNMQHLGSQRIALKTTAKTKTTLATESHQHGVEQHSGGIMSKASGATSMMMATSATSGHQRASAKRVESKYILPKPQKTDAPMLNYIFDTFSSANKHHHHDQRYGPHFEDVQRVGQPTNLTVQAGSSIHLNCRISLLQDKTVSWVRRNAQGEHALDLLTVGLNTYTGDKRYKIEFQYPNNWRLKITNVKKDDEAMYECQISTHPPRVIQINLFVNAPKVMIVDEFGDPLQEKYYEIDSTLQLSCVVRNVAMAASVVYWKHGDDVLNYDVTRGGISVKTELMDDGANSTLSIAKINKSDSGNYTCAISDFQNFSIVVHILNGESFAELHHGAAGTIQTSACHHLLVIHGALISWLLLLLLLMQHHTSAAHQHHHQTPAPLHIRVHR
ncbi:probable serine/threonine-protein kinase DDB_G0267686 [Eurosta solidaginis]|uniref:probable serine/threonine-protein kinase DDB_G0267686 n=1 Tax=Eurosta solidaginis TaxID=178769 RepID=UPI0035308199